jgi:shikimate kinase
MRLSLIAMSGSGKSYWANQLADIGFKCFSCDEMIASKLFDDLVKPDGSFMQLGKWMGLPYQQNYLERESKYLENEKQVLKEIFKIIENNYPDPESNIVIDTTGSVIYTGKEILNKLRKYTTVVYLATPPQIQDQMYRAYLARPRPVLWRGKFSKKSHEKNKEALARCYPGLVTYRERLYKRYAHITIDYDRYRKKGLNVKDFLREVNSKMRSLARVAVTD